MSGSCIGRKWLVLAILVAAAETQHGATAQAAKIGAASAPRWLARPGWTSRPPAESSVTAEDGLLVFRIRGPQTELPWHIALTERETADEPRYLVLRYRAAGLSSSPGNYFVHCWDGTVGGRLCAGSELTVADGQWHVLAIDLLPFDPPEPLSGLALKLCSDKSEKAELAVDYLELTSSLPPGATLAPSPAPPVAPTRMDLAACKPFTAAPGWLTYAASQSSATPNPEGMIFRVQGANRGMRWTGTLPRPVDLAQSPYVSVRYRLTGQPGRTTYAVWLGSEATGPGEKSVIPFLLKDLTADGTWHQATVRVPATFVAARVAVGLDSAGDSIEMQLAPLVYGARPPRWPLAFVTPHRPREEKWPDGKNGLACLPLPSEGTTPAPFLPLRLGIEGWFAAREITIDGIPFRVPAAGESLLHTGTIEKGTVAVSLPAGSRELLLLTAVVAPPTEPFGIETGNPRPQESLLHAEKVVCEIEYASGPSDFVMPVEAPGAIYGLKRGIAVHAVHPDPHREPRRLLLYDKMQTADMAILGLTVNRGKDRVSEPAPFVIPAATSGALASAGTAQSRKTPNSIRVGGGPLEAEFGTASGLSWESLGVAGAESPANVAGTLRVPDSPHTECAVHLRAAAGPLFRVTIGGRQTDSTQWTTTTVSGIPDGFRVDLKSPDATLRAAVTLAAGRPSANRRGGDLCMGLEIRAASGEARGASVVFPMLDGVTIGSAAETWYYFGRRGGVIHRAHANYREPLGEPHPMQIDGFFGPQCGVALACATHDTGRQHHFVRLAKGPRGGSWSIEYPTAWFSPGADWRATEAVLSLREGDWRAILGSYQEWLATWYRPRQGPDWFRRVFALIGTSFHYDGGLKPADRGNLVPTLENARKWLGCADLLHLFGWGASKQYGDWGDYDHYEELGGLEHFRQSVARVQGSGVPVGLYIDGYLNCTAAASTGRHAKEWAVLQPDGKPQWIPEFKAYNECPYLEPWRRHLAQTYRRVRDQLGAKGMYIDELGATDGRWSCHGGQRHGHPGEVIPYRGELELMRAIRDAVGPDVALYVEYPPSEAARQVVDGAFSYYAIWSQDQAAAAPHFVNLSRFVFPEFKPFHILSYATPRAGNWYHFKIPFFNGEGYCPGEPGLASMDPDCLAFQRKVLAIQTSHREAFASRDVAPLVPTLQPGVFANRFTGPNETVWTLFNTTGRTVRGPILDVPHRPDATYRDLWRERPIEPKIDGARAVLAVELPPQAVGCVAQQPK